MSDGQPVAVHLEVGRVAGTGVSMMAIGIFDGLRCLLAGPQQDLQSGRDHGALRDGGIHLRHLAVREELSRCHETTTDVQEWR